MTAHDYSLTIGGAAVATDAALDVRNPATGEVIATAPVAGPEHVEAAMATAHRAYPSWRSDEAGRRQALKESAAALRASAPQIAAVLTAEQGKPLSNSVIEVEFAARSFDYYASLDTTPELLLDDERTRVEVRRRPLGVAVGITPWNFPISLAAQKIAPALLAGNTMVLKPSPYTPLSTLQLGAALRECLPAGVLNVLSGDDSLGPRLTDHPVPRKLSFTGSVATGRKIAEAAVQDFKRLTLELGGNDAAIVLPGTDLRRAAIRIFWGAFINAGQTCSAIKRLYVHSSIYDDAVQALAAIASKTKVGNGADEGVLLGPLNNAPQLAKVTDLVEDAVAHGATVAAGGHRLDGPGFFYAPTIVAGLTDGVRLVDEEQFGPVLPVIAYDDVADAVARANDSAYGLGGSVWGSDTERAAEVAAELECGVAWVNSHVVLEAWQPFGGVKSSGIGTESGREGYLAFTDPQTVRTDRR